MRTARTVLSAAVAAGFAALAVALAGPAAAGGPTSVLMSVPGEGRTASLYYSDPEYAELSRLLGVEDAGGPGAGDSRDHMSERSVTVTWLIHDVQPWRVDRIYLGGSGGPWVQTQVGYEGSIWDAPTSWSRPAEPKTLLLLLERLGLEPGGTPVDGALAQPVATPAPQPLGARRASTTTGTQSSSTAPVGEPGTPWPALATGFALGLGTAAAAGVLRVRRAGRPAPDEVPADVPAEDLPPAAGVVTVLAPDTEWSPAEELVTRR
jgi:hypothetical protein